MSCLVHSFSNIADNLNLSKRERELKDIIDIYIPEKRDDLDIPGMRRIEMLQDIIATIGNLPD